MKKMTTQKEIYITRSGRKSKPPERLQYYVQTCLLSIMKMKRHGLSNIYLHTKYLRRTVKHTLRKKNTDETFLLVPDKDIIDLLFKRLGKTFKIEDQGQLLAYLVMKIERKPDAPLEWTQSTLTWRGNQRRTKHLNIKYHHFREEARKGTISIYHRRTKEQIADILIKPFPEVPCTKFREKMMSW